MSHALLAPSAAHRWLTCPAAPAFETHFPEEESAYAAEGTLAHAWAAHLLDSRNPAPAGVLDAADMAHVTAYVQFVKDETANGIRHIELPLDVSAITGESGASGTADCAALVDGTLKIIDLKFGQGVRVDAENNPQLQIYAAAALPEFDLIYEVKAVELIIYQPRTLPANISRWTITPAALAEFAAKVREAGSDCLKMREWDSRGIPIPANCFRPGEHCRFCRGRGRCPGQAAAVFQAVADEEPPATPVSMTEAARPEALSRSLDRLEMVEAWCKAVREQSLKVLKAGDEIPGYKLVLGRRGPRQWTDAAAADALLKTFKLKVEERCVLKTISPTQAERLAKAGAIGARQWARLEPLITQPDGGPQVAPDSDPRPAWSPVANPNDFRNLDSKE